MIIHYSLAACAVKRIGIILVGGMRHKVRVQISIGGTTIITDLYPQLVILTCIPINNCNIASVCTIYRKSIMHSGCSSLITIILPHNRTIDGYSISIISPNTQMVATRLQMNLPYHFKYSIIRLSRVRAYRGRGYALELLYMVCHA